MFEIGIFCVILFAVAYWAVLFIMGRRDDVLHGEFVRAETESNKGPRRGPAAVAHVAPVTAAESDAAPLPIAAAVSARPLANLPPANTKALQSLLVSLKQELKSAAKI
jgi:hypothetical protein